MKQIELTRGLSTLVDDADFEWLNKFNWWANAYGYACRKARKDDGRRTTLFMHREIMGLGPGRTVVVDHANCNKLDNRRANLRACSEAENARNRPAMSNNKSGLKGVSPMRDKWQAQILVNGEKRWLGMYRTKEEAHEIYKKAAIEHYGDFAKF